jgi:hypothetical protein
MISSVFDTVDQASGFVTVAVAKPMRQVSGILAAAKAIIESLRNSAAEPRRHAPAPPPLGDKDMFD